MSLFKCGHVVYWAKLIAAILFIQGCSDKKDFPDLSISDIPVPTARSGQSRITTDMHGQSFLSWLEHDDTDTFRLNYSKLSDQDNWSNPIEIASSSDWFVNWADFPSLTINKGGRYAVHWLQMSDSGTYDYDVHITQSTDGLDWSSSFVIHDDGIAAEHGFVTLLPLNDGQIIATWLDGRHTKSNISDANNDKHDHGHGGGAMTLRTATFDRQGSITEEYELDDRICDCCQTDIAMTNNGPIIVYRDRTDQEIRDISIVRRIDNQWSTPQPVYNDEWHINGCPVNGPSIASSGNEVMVAWFTSAEGISKVQVAYSSDGGANFALPIRIDDGDPLGRVDIEWFDQSLAMVTWLEKTGENAAIKSRWIRSNGAFSESQVLATSSSSRKSGFPILSKDKRGFLLTWTALDGKNNKVATSRISVN